MYEGLDPQVMYWNVLVFIFFTLCLSSRLIQVQELRETLVEKLKIATESTLSAEERAARMDEIMEDEEKRQKTLDTELKNLRDTCFKKSQELHEKKLKEKNIDAEIQVPDCCNT